MDATETYAGSEERIANHSDDSIRKMNDVFARCLGSFHRRAYRYLGNAADADDAVQDALLSACKHIDQFRGEAQMSSWLTAIVSNSARMQLRRRPRQKHLSIDERLGDDQEYSLSDMLPNPEPGPEDQCQQSELRGHILRLVEKLSPCLRRTFQLREVDGLTTSEAAHMLGVAEGTVKAQLTRARAKLRRLIRPGLNSHAHALRTCTPPSLSEK